MTKILKRERKDSAADLVSAIDDLNPLLAEQGEHDAVAYLKKTSSALKKSPIGSDEYKKAVEQVIEAFDGDLELSAYTHARKDSKEWTAAEELTVVSCRVLNLAKRMKA